MNYKHLGACGGLWGLVRACRGLPISNTQILNHVHVFRTYRANCICKNPLRL